MKAKLLKTRDQAPQPQSADRDYARLQALPGPQVSQRWQARDDFVVLDTGFDLGLKFLALWQAWRADPERPQRLHYLAFELAPYTAGALQAALQHFPELASLSQELCERWPLALPGFHRILLSDVGVCLTLIFGQWQDKLPQIEAQVDTFLVARDELPLGEADAKLRLNWFGRLAANGAQISLPFGEHVDAALLQGSAFIPEPGAEERANFAPRWKVIAPAAPEARSAVVIGAGLAGSAICERLTARGWQVTLIERHEDAAQEASGNLAGVFMPLLARDDNPASRLSRAALLFALRVWQGLGGIGVAFDGAASGVLQLARDEAHAAAAHELAQQVEYPLRFARYLDEQQAWLFEQGGWANPAGVCRAMLAACGDRLQRMHGRSVAQLAREDGLWNVTDAAGARIAQASCVVVANGMHGNAFAQTAQLPLAALRGQVTHVPGELLPEIATPICGDGYVTPAYRGMCSVGATYDDSDDVALSAASQQENIARLIKLFPHLSSALQALPLSGRVGFRCVSPDRLPLVGALPDFSALENFRGERLRDVPRHPGLYGLLAYASRGLIWAPLAAELLAAQMSGEPLPLERELSATLDPARFILQALRKTKNKS